DQPAAIALISGIVLVLELAFIRQMPAEVRVISYFTNLLLMAAFFGLGVGCILQRWRRVDWLLPLGVALTAGFILLGRGIVIYPEAEAVHYWLQYNQIDEARAPRLPMVPAGALAFLITSLPFIALGQALARAMDRHPRLLAYGWDIAGSLAGVIVFSASAYLHTPPWLWPPLVMSIWALVFMDRPLPRLATVAAGLLFLAFASSPLAWRWSPYYFIQHQSEDAGLRVWVNGSFHQYGIDFTSEVAAHRALQRDMAEKWSRPYRLYAQLHGGPPQKVLILGAGTGNDVNVARVNGVEEIVAVEIDPVILELGRTENPTDPYGDPRVRAHVDDARHFLRASDERFDMIIYGTLDSQVLLASQANLRLENYVYTREALLDAKRLLNDDGGMLAVYYSVFRPWLYERIYSTVRGAFGENARIYFDENDALFNTTIVAVEGRDDFRAPSAMLADYGTGRMATDDWPFVYLQAPGIAPVYVQLMAVIGVLIAGAFVLLRRLHPVTGLHLDFLLLGLGFTLMQSSAIVRLALLFGSTWTVNAVVFAAMLTMIFVANALVMKGWAPGLRGAWPLLLAFIVVNYAFPMQWLLGLDAPARVVACSLLIGAPVFAAAVCFSRLFAKQPITGYPLGINLIGAMAGGLVEYVSMATGMRAIWLIVLAVYAGAWLISTWIARRGGAAAAAA
ncbi:MAG: hypothetical protein AAF772_16930, partial [Acidobacteriota bacterium]